MLPVKSMTALASVLALGACAVAPPAGPSVMALPQQGKDFAQFQQDDSTCRAFATNQTGGANPSGAATNAAVGSAAVGTVVGGAVGALVGAAVHAPAAGAAIGAGTGLAVGASNGAANAAAVGGNLQARYDTAYTQCMYSNGDKVVAQPGVSPGYGYPAYPYAYPAYGYLGPAYYEPPVVAFGFGGGYGYRGGWGDRGGYGYRGGWDHR